jgi:hypothetical protein
MLSLTFNCTNFSWQANKISNFILQIGTWQMTDRTWVKKVLKALGLGLPKHFFNPCVVVMIVWYLDFKQKRGYLGQYCMQRFGFMVFNATFNNISVISWQSVLLVEKTTDLS